MHNLKYKITLRYIYLKSLLNQKIFRDGSFPYEDYSKLTDYIRKYNVKNALECGTAVGLSAISIMSGNEEVRLTTIEKHKRNIEKARKNIFNFDKINLYKKLNFENRIRFVEGNYFKVLENEEFEKIKLSQNQNDKFDFIFLDCYISRYAEVRFLYDYLKIGGVFVVSNIREDISKSVLAKNFLENKILTDEEDIKNINNRHRKFKYKILEEDEKMFEFLEEIEDTMFVRKIR